MPEIIPKSSDSRKQKWNRLLWCLQCMALSFCPAASLCALCLTLVFFFFAFLSVFPLFRIPSSLRFRLPTQHQQLHSYPPCVFGILGNSHPWASGHPLGKQKVQYHVLHKPAEKKVPVFPSLRTNRKHAE